MKTATLVLRASCSWLGGCLLGCTVSGYDPGTGFGTGDDPQTSGTASAVDSGSSSSSGGTTEDTGMPVTSSVDSGSSGSTSTDGDGSSTGSTSAGSSSTGEGGSSSESTGEATGEGLPCVFDSDCLATAPVCGPDDVCHDGDVGDPCVFDSDCPASFACVDDVCYDGVAGDPCVFDNDCAGGLDCPLGGGVCG
ncbi:hypothetical protein [Paraliomyxa miuraensis]|uniref:hypothetical protein n=1 Tax=Paraliomyxa miuraensis TaxID=376150 RepID=UPI00225B3C63|nr:hypothetical protein [Paraliomyxa miuraensis]MCX4244955.1 hypothetical protein [Paraliomyxa miuraensis]